MRGAYPVADNTVASCRSPRLETLPGFPPQLSSPPLQLVAVNSGAVGGGDSGGVGSEGAGSRGDHRSEARAWTVGETGPSCVCQEAPNPRLLLSDLVAVDRHTASGSSAS
ncbi:unnamed protein product, partial [Closterium sp. NIES-54]